MREVFFYVERKGVNENARRSLPRHAKCLCDKIGERLEIVGFLVVSCEYKPQGAMETRSVSNSSMEARRSIGFFHPSFAR